MSRARRVYESFHGHRATRQGELDVRSRELVLVGKLVAIEYNTVRDGKIVIPRHVFSARSAPLLYVDATGNDLWAIDGQFKFGARGFIDT